MWTREKPTDEAEYWYDDEHTGIIRVQTSIWEFDEKTTVYAHNSHCTVVDRVARMPGRWARCVPPPLPEGE